jgi:O-antigen/teichoic acid export membrane protein
MIFSRLLNFRISDFSFSTLRRSKTAHTIAIFASGNMVAMLLGVVGSLVQARYVGPEDIGVLRYIGIVAGYLTFLHLGVFEGLQREIPFRLARGNRDKAEQAASSCLVWITFVSISCGIVFLSLAFRAAYYREWMQFWGWLAFTPSVVSTFYGGYLGTTFRTGQQFIQFSKASVIQAVTGTLVLPLMPIMGYYGACLRAAVTSISNLFLLHRWRPMRVRLSIDWPSFREVIKIGLPMSGIGYIYTSLWASLEGTFVLEWFGLKALGLFSMAVFIRTIVVQLSQNMNQVLSVKICEQYGRSHCVEDCLLLIVKPIIVAFLASLPLIGVAWLLLPWVVTHLIPNYIDAIQVMQIMLLMMPILFLRLPASILLAAARRMDTFISVITGFLVFVGCSYLFYKLDFGMVSVAIASILGQIVSLLAVYLIVLKLIRWEKADLMPKKNDEAYQQPSQVECQ